jgi:hypothetical protein
MTLARLLDTTRSSNRTCGFLASGFPTGFVARPTMGSRCACVSGMAAHLRLAIELCPTAPELIGRFKAHRQCARPPRLRKRARSQGPLLRRSYPASMLLRPCPTPARGLHPEDGVEVRTLAQSGSPPITRAALLTCRVHYPDGPNGCMCRLLLRSHDLPRIPGGSASILKLSRPAQTSLALRPAGSLSRPRRPLSRGSSPASHPAKPLVSYQINRQLSGWNLPPLATRAVGAHGN